MILNDVLLLNRAIYFCSYAQAKHWLCEECINETPRVHLLSAAFAGKFGLTVCHLLDLFICSGMVPIVIQHLCGVIHKLVWCLI